MTIADVDGDIEIISRKLGWTNPSRADAIDHHRETLVALESARVDLVAAKAACDLAAAEAAYAPVRNLTNPPLPFKW